MDGIRGRRGSSRLRGSAKLVLLLLLLLLLLLGAEVGVCVRDVLGQG